MTWLMDRRGRDQFGIQHDRQHKVCWNDPKKGCAELFHQRSAPTEWSPLPLIWSPQGTYICSLHPPLGAALWASKANGCARSSRTSLWFSRRFHDGTTRCAIRYFDGMSQFRSRLFL